MHDWTITALTGFVQGKLHRAANPAKAGSMAAYMKTDMPFYGVQKPDRLPIYRQMRKQFQPLTQKRYEDAVLAIWGLEHREEKYTAIEYARQHKQFVTAQSYPLYERLIKEGAWWDLVDDVAISIVSDSYLHDRQSICPIIDTWIDDRDRWIRRAALLSHNHHKGQTDSAQLFKHVMKTCHEKEFFIAKAIGWALREYSYANPRAVAQFLKLNKSRLSTLSFREASKALLRK